jgi:hypothetical protein
VDAKSEERAVQGSSLAPESIENDPEKVRSMNERHSDVPATLQESHICAASQMKGSANLQEVS